MHLFYFLLIVTSLSCGSLPTADMDRATSLAATIAMITGWSLLPHVAARILSNFAKQGEIDPHESARWLEIQLDVFRWLGLGIAIVCLSTFGLARSIEQIPIVGESMFLQGALLFTPGLLLTISTWSAEHYYGVRMGYAPNGLPHHFAAIWRSFRCGIAWLVAPVLVLLGLSDLVGCLPVTDTALTIIRAVGIAVFVPIVMPWMIRHLFQTEKLSSDLHVNITGLLRAAGAGRTDAVRWNTGGHSFNAMVAGFVPPVRTLFLTDRLIDELPTDQLAMVILHEAAHLRRRHLPLRMVGVVPAWLAGMLVSWIFADQAWSTMAGSVVGITTTLLLLRWISYRTEFDADVTACRLAVDLSGQFEWLPSSYDQAQRSLGEALYQVTSSHPSSRAPSWLHPGVDQRIDFMQEKGTQKSLGSLAGSPA